MFEATASTGAPIDVTYYLRKIFDFNLRTVDIGRVVPNIVNHYGIQFIKLEIDNLLNSKVEFHLENVILDISWRMKITIDEETAVLASFKNTNIIADLHSSNGAILGNIKSIELGGIGSDF